MKMWMKGHCWQQQIIRFSKWLRPPGQKLKVWGNLNIFIPNNDNVILKSKLFSLMNSIHTASIPIYQLSEIILSHKRPLVCLSILGRYSIGTSDKPLSVNLRLKDWSKKGSRCRSEQRIVFPLLGLVLFDDLPLT